MDKITDKIGDWVQVDAETHVMPLEIEVGETDDDDDDSVAVFGARCIMQVETEAGAVALVETFIPATLLMRWIEEEDEED